MNAFEPPPLDIHHVSIQQIVGVLMMIGAAWLLILGVLQRRRDRAVLAARRLAATRQAHRLESRRHAPRPGLSLSPAQRRDLDRCWRGAVPAPPEA